LCYQKEWDSLARQSANQRISESANRNAFCLGATGRLAEAEADAEDEDEAETSAAAAEGLFRGMFPTTLLF
jgi:hypothetical protein